MKLLYTISTPGGHAKLDELVRLATNSLNQLAGSHLVANRACILLRLESDAGAVLQAITLVGPDDWAIHAGYGINRRLVAQALPGCTCSQLAEWAGCEVCICPGCGTARRYGVSPEHPMACLGAGSLARPTTT